MSWNTSLSSTANYRAVREYDAKDVPPYQGTTYSDSDISVMKYRSHPPQLPQGPCLLTGDLVPCLEGRMLPVGTTKELLGVLEYAWCLDFGALDLSSPEHVVCLRADFLEFLECGYLYFIPEPEVIQQLHQEFVTRRAGPSNLRTSFPQKTFGYRLLVSPQIDDCCIMRRSIKSEDDSVASVDTAAPSAPHHEADFELFWSPFKELGPLKSTIRPERAMTHLWLALKDLDATSAGFQALSSRLDYILGTQGDLGRIIETVAAWTSFEAPRDFVEQLRLYERVIPPPDLQPVLAGIGVQGIFGEPQFGWPYVSPDEYAPWPEELEHEEEEGEGEYEADDEDELPPPPILEASNSRVLAWKDRLLSSSKDDMQKDASIEVDSKRSRLYADETTRQLSELQVDDEGELVASYSRDYKDRPQVAPRKKRWRRESLDSNTSSNYW